MELCLTHDIVWIDVHVIGTYCTVETGLLAHALMGSIAELHAYIRECESFLSPPQ